MNEKMPNNIETYKKRPNKMKEMRMTSPPNWAGSAVEHNGQLLTVYFQDAEVNTQRDYEDTLIRVCEETNGRLDLLAETQLSKDQTSKWRTESGEITREGRQALASEVVELLTEKGQIK